MAVTIKASATRTGAQFIVLPNGIAANDLILVFVGAYNGAPSIATTGYTTAFNATATSSMPYYMLASRKIAAGNESGTTLDVSVPNDAYGGIVVHIISGHNITSPIDSINWNPGSGGGIGSGAVSSNSSVTPIGVIGHMAGNATIPEFTTSWGTQITTIAGSGGYSRLSTYQRPSATGVVPSLTGTSSGTSGDNIAGIVNIREGANVYTKQSGAFVLGSGKKVRQGGVWVSAPPTKTKAGGVFN